MDCFRDGLPAPGIELLLEGLVCGPELLLGLFAAQELLDGIGLQGALDEGVAHIVKLIAAEARGESYVGQVAVGAVVLNRVAHAFFPDSIAGVIYQKGAFSCINDSNWAVSATETSRKAARDCINGWDPSGGAVYYFNPRKTNDSFKYHGVHSVWISCFCIIE